MPPKPCTAADLAQILVIWKIQIKDEGNLQNNNNRLIPKLEQLMSSIIPQYSPHIRNSNFQAWYPKLPNSQKLLVPTTTIHNSCNGHKHLKAHNLAAVTITAGCGCCDVAVRRAETKKKRKHQKALRTKL
jgi:hypothetical protein